MNESNRPKRDFKEFAKASVNGGMFPDEIRNPNQEPDWVAKLDKDTANKVRTNREQNQIWNPETNKYEKAPYLPIPDFQIKEQ